jgi:hypothetical protein
MKTVAILSLLLMACSAPAVPPPAAQESALPESTSPSASESASDPDIRGEVTHVEGGRIRVESLPKEQRGDKAVVTLDDDTIVRDSAGRTASASAVRVGQTVRVWYTGAVMKSYPLQATAARVEIE